MMFNILIFTILVQSCLGAPIRTFSSIKPIIQETTDESPCKKLLVPELKTSQIVDIVCAEEKLLSIASALQTSSVSHGY